MKVFLFNISLFFFGLTLFTACNRGETEQNATEQTVINQDSTQKTNQEAALYTCPMHPEVTSTAPGKCSKCGMNLEIAKAGEHQDHADHNH